MKPAALLLVLAVRTGPPEEFDAFVKMQLKEMAELIAYIEYKPEP